MQGVTAGMAFTQTLTTAFLLYLVVFHQDRLDHGHAGAQVTCSTGHAAAAASQGVMVRKGCTACM